MTLSAIGIPKLFCFQPKGYGEYSAFVMADSDEEAREYIKKALQEQKRKDEEYTNWKSIEEMPKWVDLINMEGLDTDYYEVTVLNYGEVCFNANE